MEAESLEGVGVERLSNIYFHGVYFTTELYLLQSDYYIQIQFLSNKEVMVIKIGGGGVWRGGDERSV